MAANRTIYSAFRQGTVDGRWVGLVLDFSGTNGGSDHALIFMVGPGGNGLKTTEGRQIAAEGQYGDRMDGLFANGKLYVTNDIYLPAEPHCCPTHAVVQRFGFHNGELVREGFASIALPASGPLTRQAILRATLIGPYIP